MIKYLIFDADHTILEFDDDEMRAFYEAFASYGILLSEAEVKACRDFSYREWERRGLYDVHTEKIQKNYHEIYREYVYGMFEVITSHLSERVDCVEMADRFMKFFCKEGHIIGNSLSVMRKLSQKYVICVATNGLKEAQMGRLRGFDCVSEYFISEEIGTIKPNEEFFSHVLKALNATGEECLMIGDSLSSDMAGAVKIGMKSCWFNRFKKKNTQNFTPDHEIESIDELLNML